MAQQFKARDKQVQKMTKDGLVEINLADKTTASVSSRTKDVKMARSRSPDEGELSLKDTSIKEKASKISKQVDMSRNKSKKKLVQSRGDARKEKSGGTTRPQAKKRLKFDAEEVGVRDTEQIVNEPGSKEVLVKKTKMEHTRKQTAAKKFSATDKPRNPPTTNSGVKKYYTKNQKSDNGRYLAKRALRHEVEDNMDDNSAVEAASSSEKLAEHSIRMQRARNQRSSIRKDASTTKEQGMKETTKVRKFWQKKQIQKGYQAEKRAETAGTATVGTIDYIKKIGGKVTNFFKENRKVYLSIAVFLGLLLILMSSISSCGASFFQSTVTYTATSYLSEDEAIRLADLYYTQLETELQERIDNMESEEPGYEEYRYNVGPIEHDPFVLISYLSAKYEEFTYNQVISEMDRLFAEQYQLETEVTTESITETRMVRVGESLGNVVTSGYCNCSICCGQWAGGATASGAMPTANHTIAVDASTPTVPMGTKVIMNGVEYTVEDTGNFTRYGVDFDVYYDNHSAAQAHGHKTWEAFIADNNGTREVEVTNTRTVDVLNVTLQSGSLTGICNERLDSDQKELFSAYNETKGNLQMFGSPFEFNWYGRVTSYYGYRKHPIDGVTRMHNGLDIAAAEGTVIQSGLEGMVEESSYNDSYGNYVFLKNSKGYEIRYAHLSSRSVSTGDTVAIGDEIGKVGSTGDSTGAHLHLELLKGGNRMNPIFYFETGTAGIGGTGEYTSDGAGRLLEEAEKHLGTPYVWGGYRPGAFDCSGFVSYCLTTSGVRNTGRLTAQGLYDICTPVSEAEVQPGDLIFFTGTYNSGTPISHVGIYAGNGQMIHCGDPIQYVSIYSSYWQAHFYGFGRW